MFFISTAGFVPPNHPFPCRVICWVHSILPLQSGLNPSADPQPLCAAEIMKSLGPSIKTLGDVLCPWSSFGDGLTIIDPPKHAQKLCLWGLGKIFGEGNLLKVVRREEGTTGYGGHSALILRHPPFAKTHLGHSRLVDGYMAVSQKFHWQRPGSQGNVSIGEEKNRKWKSVLEQIKWIWCYGYEWITTP